MLCFASLLSYIVGLVFCRPVVIIAVPMAMGGWLDGEFKERVERTEVKAVTEARVCCLRLVTFGRSSRERKWMLSRFMKCQ